MRRLTELSGTTLYLFARPVIKLFLNNTERTRVLIVCGHKLVLVKNWLGSGKWGLPGGGLHKGEDKIAGAIREVGEEIGLSLDESQLDFVKRQNLIDEGISTELFIYVVRLDQEPLLKAQRLEIFELSWVDLDLVKSLNCSPDVALAIEASQRYLVG